MKKPLFALAFFCFLGFKNANDEKADFTVTNIKRPSKIAANSFYTGNKAPLTPL